MRWPTYPHDESHTPGTGELDHVHFEREQIVTIAQELATAIRENLAEIGCTCNAIIDVSVPVCSKQAPWHHVEHLPGCRHWSVRRVMDDDLIIGGVN